MKYPYRTLSPLFSVVTFILLIPYGCSSEDTAEKMTDTFWTEAKLNDFPLSEIAYLNINIIHPEVTQGKETKRGTIQITIPFSQTSFMLSLKQFNLDLSRYQINPAIGEQTDFSNGPVTYTIFDPLVEEKSVHYDVTVVQGGEPFFANSRITGFRFEKANNPSLATTIEAVKIAEYKTYSYNAIYVIVPEGTDFSQLIPTITYDAAKLYYTTDSEYSLYPTSNLKVDFRYPKHFHLQAENSHGTRSLPYSVIVDVANPIRFENPLITGSVRADNGATFEDFFAIATWTNRGNHPITGMSATTYKDKTYPATGFPDDFTAITASLQNPDAGTIGVMPGEKGQINVRVKRLPVTGQYKATAEFTPTFSFDTRRISVWPVAERVEGIFNPQQLMIQTTIIE